MSCQPSMFSGNAASASVAVSASSNDVPLPVCEEVNDLQQRLSPCSMLPLQSFPPTSHSPCNPSQIVDECCDGDYDDGDGDPLSTAAAGRQFRVLVISTTPSATTTAEDQEHFRRVSGSGGGGEFSLHSVDSNASLRRHQRLWPSTTLQRPTSLRRVCSMRSAGPSVFSPTLFADIASSDEAALQSLVVGSGVPSYSFGELYDNEREAHFRSTSLASSIPTSSTHTVSTTEAVEGDCK